MVASLGFVCAATLVSAKSLMASYLGMQKLEENRQPPANGALVANQLPVSVIIAVRNEAGNLPRCLDALREMGEVYVVDSQSTDSTVEIARTHGAQVVQFHYQGGWPKKRQWAMDNLPLAHQWILLLDADEVVTPDLVREIRGAIENSAVHGYYIALRIHFLGRVLRHGDEVQLGTLMIKVQFKK